MEFFVNDFELSFIFYSCSFDVRRVINTKTDRIAALFQLFTFFKFWEKNGEEGKVQILK